MTAGDSDDDDRDERSITEVAQESSYVRERPPDIARGTVLASRYQIEDVIGKGGSGVVLRVFDRTAQNVVALKVLKAELARDAKWERRFSRELRLGRPIQHPNVCRIFDIGEAEGHRFLTMELATGGSLRDELKRNRSAPRPLEVRLADAKAVIAGLAALHTAGVVHRDFKPDNLLRMEDGRLVLSDFGLATDAANAPGATVLIGTPHYMAPEVLAGEPASTRSDVWALGVVLHEIFFGQRPERRSMSFDGSNKTILRPATSVERAMLKLCDACLAESPLDRPTDARVVAQLWESARTGGGHRRRWSHRLAAYGLALAALAIGGAGWIARSRRRAIVVATPAAGLPRLHPTGTPIDWRRAARMVTEIEGRVYCFSLFDEQTARVVWGTPRQAEDIDLGTGKRRPAALLPETYRVGCPQLAPDGQSLLFTGQNASGTSEIRLASAPDGAGATTVTSGSEPLWLGGGESFVYSVDVAHAAVYSLPTTSFTLLAIPELGKHQVIADKAVNLAGSAIALMTFDDRVDYALTLLDDRSFSHATSFALSNRSWVRFGARNDRVLVTEPQPESGTPMATVDWSSGAATTVGAYAGFDPAFVAASGRREAVLLQRMTGDVWSYQGEHPRQLTTDGKALTAALSPAGDLLVSRIDTNGTLSIWRQSPNGSLTEVTHGPNDVRPNFAPDGKRWLYSDYTRTSIMLCEDDKGCRVLRKDDYLPAAPTFSPDGAAIAYISQLDRPRLTILAAADGHPLASWDAYSQCAPVWSSPTTVWTLEAAGGHYLWVERDIRTGVKTGKQLEKAAGSLEWGQAQCLPAEVSRDSPFFQPIRVERKFLSRVLLPDGSLG